MALSSQRAKTWLHTFDFDAFIAEKLRMNWSAFTVHATDADLRSGASAGAAYRDLRTALETP
jgi:hypothetical protein